MIKKIKFIFFLQPLSNVLLSIYIVCLKYKLMSLLEIILSILAGLLLLSNVALCLFEKKRKELVTRKILQEAKEANDEKLRFYTNITHELKSPLTLIIGPLEDLTHNNDIPETAKDKIVMALKNSQQLLSLVNQCLDFRKVETNNWSFSVCYDSISEKVRDLSDSFIKTNTNPDIGFILEIEDNLRLFFDPKIVQVIMNNFLTNAIKYTKRGTILIFCRRQEYNKSMYVELGVTDTGMGISKKDKKHIFDRYYQGEHSQLVSGTGIGLAMVKNLAEKHEMTLKVDSTLGKGSTFKVLLGMDNTYPSADHYDSGISTEEDSQENAIEPLHLDENITELSKKPIIVAIDDNAEMTQYISSLLSNSYTVISASNGIQGTRFIIKYIPDLVICDIMMPFMNGFEVCERVKRDLRTSHIPVMLLTAKESDEDKTRGYDVGADSYITKPFSSELLKSRVKNLLDAKKRTANRIVTETIQKSISKSGKQQEYNKGLSDIDKEFIVKMTKFIKENISSEDLDVCSIASEMCMSQSTLYRKVKGLLGISPNEYIRKVRMSVAADMIKSGACNVSEAAWKVNINSLAYFRKCFKEEFGVFPSQYKNASSQNATDKQ